MSIKTIYIAPNPLAGGTCRVYQYEGTGDPKQVPQVQMKKLGLLQATYQKKGPYFQPMWLSAALAKIRDDILWSMAGVCFEVVEGPNGVLCYPEDMGECS